MTQTTIAQLLYLDAPPLNFARLVAELDRIIAHLPSVDYTLTWDCEDVAIFRSGSLRVLLAITDVPGTDYAACLTITAGPDTPGAAPTPLLRRADHLCRLIEGNLAATTRPDAVLWHSTPRIATADLVDTMVWSLSDGDLVSWALPTTSDLPQRAAPPLQPRFRPAVPREAPAPWGVLRMFQSLDRATARALALGAAFMAYGGPQLFRFI